MSKSLPWLILLGLGIGAWYFLTNYQISGLENLSVQSRRPDPAVAGPEGPAAPSRPVLRRTLRIAAANFGPLDGVRLASQQVLGILAQVIRRFDVVALQDVRAQDQGPMVRLVEQVNAPGRRYDFAVPPSVGRGVVRQYGAVVFDTETVLIDRATIAAVDERSGQFCHPPLVVGFRASQPPEREAFTFSLINVQTPSDRVEPELAALARLFRTVRDDGRGEDDILLVGTLGTDPEQFGPLADLPNLAWAISGVPTTMRGGRLVDNILFDRRATVEFTYRCGVLDLMREFHLSAREAAEISDHLPVWAEFSVFEGGQPGHVPSGGG
ncbi:MAG: hypothetical protein ACUVUC_14235 [Thermoguttaceae bacterium]